MEKDAWTTLTIIPNQLERDPLDRSLEKFSSLDDLPQSVLAAELVVLGVPTSARC